MIVKELLVETIQNPKVGYSVSAATTASGLGFLSWIPNDIGKLATVIGIVLSVVLIISHIRKMAADRERHNLEIKKLKRELRRSDD
jgi:hypothetical protein